MHANLFMLCTCALRTWRGRCVHADGCVDAVRVAYAVFSCPRQFSVLLVHETRPGAAIACLLSLSRRAPGEKGSLYFQFSFSSALPVLLHAWRSSCICVSFRTESRLRLFFPSILNRSRRLPLRPPSHPHPMPLHAPLPGAPPAAGQRAEQCVPLDAGHAQVGVGAVRGCICLLHRVVGPGSPAGPKTCSSGCGGGVGVSSV